MTKVVIPGKNSQQVDLGVYQHFKGNKYQVIGVGLDSRDKKPVVIYQALYGDRMLWTRPVHEWADIVDYHGEYVPRFKFISSY